MNFGEKLRQLRKQNDWTQPQLADAIGIEQSYLSKIENGKSIPSADIYQLILSTFGVNTAKLLEGVDEAIVHRQLRQIPEVANFLVDVKSSQRQQQKRGMVLSLTGVILGISMLLSGYCGLIYANTQYNYVSYGIVLSKESKDVFSNYSKGVFANNEERESKRKEMKSRLDEDYWVLPEYRGEIFNVPQGEGSRTYRLNGQRNFQHPFNRYFILLGIVATLLGISGLVLQKKLARIVA